MKLLALDGGGSKTVCLVTDEHGRLLGWGRGGPSNLSFVSREAAEASIGASVRTALATAGEGGINVAVCGGPVLPGVMEAVVRREAMPAVFKYVPEAPCCLASGDGAEYGAVVLAGTGCFQYALSPDGRSHRTDGWGSLLGDEGSAYSIAQQGLIAVARAADGRGPETALSRAVLDHFGAESLRQVTRRIHSERWERHQIARLAPLVTALAAADPVAREVVHGAAVHLARGVLTCIGRVGLNESRFDLVLCGGAFRGGTALSEPLVCMVKQQAPGARPVRPAYEPVYGTLRLAFAAAGVKWMAACGEAFEHSLAESSAEPLVRTA